MPGPTSKFGTMSALAAPIARADNSNNFFILFFLRVVSKIRYIADQPMY